MALIIGLESKHGLNAPLYWRLNNFEQFANREPDGSRIPAIVRFRAYVSEEAFRAGKGFLDEMLISFESSSVNADLATEAYAALIALDPSKETGAAVEEAKEAVKTAKRVEAEAVAAAKEIPEGKDGSTVINNATDAVRYREAAQLALADAEEAHATAVAIRKIIKAAKKA